MSENRWDFVGHQQILVGQCLMTDCYLQPCFYFLFLCFDFLVIYLELLYISTCVAAYVQVGTLYAPVGVMLVTGQEISAVFTFSDSPDLQVLLLPFGLDARHKIYKQSQN